MVSALHPSAPPEKRRVPGWIGDLVASAVILTFALVPYPGDDVFQPKGLVTVGLTAVPVALLPFRRRWPITVLALCVALYGVVALAGTLSVAVGLACAIAAFGVAVRHGRRTATIATAAAVVAIIALSLLVTIVSAFDPRAFQMAITVAFAGAAGDATRSRRAYIQAVTDRAVRAEETRESEAKRRVAEERLRIARDLHDAVAHQISVISLNAGVAASALESRPEEAKEALGTIRAASRAVLGEIGDLFVQTTETRPPSSRRLSRASTRSASCSTGSAKRVSTSPTGSRVNSRDSRSQATSSPSASSRRRSRMRTSTARRSVPMCSSWSKWIRRASS